MDDREKKRRFFAGIALDDAARARCAGVSEGLQRTGFAAKYESAEKFHVTLAFLGNAGASQADAIEAALDGVAAQNAPFALTLDKIGAFPHERRPRVVYIGAREQGASFRALAQAARVAYAALGFVFHDDSVAHVTIARVKDPRAPLRSIEFAPIAFEVGTVSLFESIFDATANTSRYEIVSSAELSC
ncbi:MAG TPA: RNA 2',3'-cyclic phosphodiesterase [Candidatus Cybelea sp.]|nr:RNA 2',3'-cyclic phosphodiesterase [Candidatus Cybelea sp.]